jgi:Uma2 family endonuclease
MPTTDRDLSIRDVIRSLRTAELPCTLRLYDITEEQFDELVDEDTKAELLDGVMIVHSPASMEHDDVGGFLRSLANFHAGMKQAGKVYGPDSLVHLGICRRFAPDVYFLRQKRVPRRRRKQFEGAPDWVIEVLSPTNRADDLEDKRPAYQYAGVEEIWFVDTEQHQVVIDRKGRKGYTEEVVTEGRAVSRVLAGFWVDVAWLWAYPLPEPMGCLQQILAGAE